MTKPPTTSTNQDKRPGVTVHMPAGIQPDVIIPYETAETWMRYGQIGYKDHNSEWGCAVKLERDDENNVIKVVDWEPYKIDANAGYWESIEGERQRHADELIAAGKEDELQHWNGLFHTHPIGSGASMSGTDKQQLEDMASGGWWAVSIICPANREGVVHENRFMHHYADSRGLHGMIVVSNLKPKVSSAPVVVDEELERIREHMKQLMVKVPKAPATTGFQSWQSWSRSEWTKPTHRYNHTTKQLEPVSESDVDAKAYPAGIRDQPYTGDWVFVEKVELTSYDMAKLTKEQQAEVASLEGKTVKVIDEDREGYITTDASHYGFKTKWVLDPKYRSSLDRGDDVLVVAREDSLEARVIEKGIEAGIDPAQMGCVRAAQRDARIEPVVFEVGHQQQMTEVIAQVRAEMLVEEAEEELGAIILK